MAAVIDDAPYVLLTIGLRNGHGPPAFVVHVEIVTQVRGRGVVADLLDRLRAVRSRQPVTSLGQRCLGVWMVAPVLAGVETGGGGRGRAQSGCGNEEGGKMHCGGGG